MIYLYEEEIVNRGIATLTIICVTNHGQVFASLSCPYNGSDSNATRGTDAHGGGGDVKFLKCPCI